MIAPLRTGSLALRITSRDVDKLLREGRRERTPESHRADADLAGVSSIAEFRELRHHGREPWRTSMVIFGNGAHSQRV